MTEIDPLTDEPIGRGGVRRDRYDNALLFPRGIPKRVPYTSASSMADIISSQYAIHLWEKRYLARGLGMREDLAALCGAEVYTTGFGLEDIGENKASGRRLDEHIRRALDTARVHEKADYGTAGHLLTEPGQIEAGGYVPERMRADVAAFQKAMRGLPILATELFVANDRLMSAGTFDHLLDGDIIAEVHPELETQGTVVVQDKKFGKLKPGAFAVQMAVYATSELYDTETDERMTFEEAFGKPMNTRWGITAHIPAGEGRCDLLPTDLTDGLAAAEHAIWVRAWQKRNDQLRKPLDTNALESAAARRAVLTARSREELSHLYGKFEDVWTDELTQLGMKALTSS